MGEVWWVIGLLEMNWQVAKNQKWWVIWDGGWGCGKDDLQVQMVGYWLLTVYGWHLKVIGLLCDEWLELGHRYVMKDYEYLVQELAGWTTTLVNDGKLLIVDSWLKMNNDWWLGNMWWIMNDG